MDEIVRVLEQCAGFWCILALIVIGGRPLLGDEPAKAFFSLTASAIEVFITSCFKTIGIIASLLIKLIQALLSPERPIAKRKS
jgi:hypothetical protein